MGEKSLERIAQLEFVGQAEFDIDALNAIRVLGQTRQRNHHVFVDLESIGVARDGRCALAVQPEFFARICAGGNEALAGTRVGDAYHFGRSTRYHISVFTGNVTHQHHLG